MSRTSFPLAFFILLSTVAFISAPLSAQDNHSAGSDAVMRTIKPGIASARLLKYDQDGDYCFHDGLCALKKNQLWGFIDTTGTWVIEPKYFQWGKNAPVFSDGICLLATRAADGIGNVPVYLDKKGNQLFKNQTFQAASSFYDGIAVIGKESGPVHAMVYSFINTQGVVLTGTAIPKFAGGFFEFGPYGNGLTKMWDDKLNSYGFVDTKGKWVIKPENRKWEEAATFSDDRCAVQNTTNFYWGYIDKTGATKVPFDYQQKPAQFSCKRALVKNSKYQAGYIDTDGNLALGFNYTLASFDFHDGFALVTIDNPQLTKAVIDTQGNIVKELEDSYRDVTVNTDGTIVYQPKEQDGLRVLRPNGSILLYDAMYLDIKSFSDNRAYVEFYEEGNQSGFINRNGELVILRQD